MKKAFPLEYREGYIYEEGLSKREYFAAAALPEIIRKFRVDKLSDKEYYSIVAKAAVKAADALIHALDETN